MGSGNAHELAVSADDLERVRAVEDQLDRFAVGGDSLRGAVEALSALLGAPLTSLHRLKPDAEGDLAVDTLHVAGGLGPARMRAAYDAWLDGRCIDGTGHHPLSPPPEERNRVFSTRDLRPDGERSPIERELYVELGAGDHETLRVLVCDGPSLLAWVGIMQPDQPTPRQRRLLDACVPALRRRLVFERWVREGQLAAAALEPALEAIGGAAWVVDGAGRVAHANAAGRVRLDAARADVERMLAAVAAGTVVAGVRATTFTADGGRVGLVVVERTASTHAARAGALAGRAGLTPAQARVLERVTQGLSNATIAAQLGIAERTVEAHVTAILAKVQVPSRAALIATALGTA